MKRQRLFLIGALAALTGLSAAAEAVTLTPVLLRTHDGTASHDAFGHSVAAVGDFDGDMIGDYAVGAPDHVVDPYESGQVTVFSGASGSALMLLDPLAAPGIQAVVDFGWTVAAAGDVNNDGTLDVVAEAQFAFEGVGAALVYSGADGTLLRVFEGDPQGYPYGYFATALAGVGDYDGDGYDDVAVGAPNYIAFSAGCPFGILNVFSGASGSDLYFSNGDLSGYQGSCDRWSLHGASVAALGDVDGDGRADFVVGDPGWDATSSDPFDHGVAHFVSSSGTVSTLTNPGVDALFGTYATAIDDVDSDGVRDFVVASPRWLSPSSDVFGFSGATLSPLFSAVDIGPSAPVGMLGISFTPLRTPLSGWVDYDGDGVPNLIVGDPGFDGGAGIDAGIVRILDGDTGAVRVTIEGQAPQDYFGSSVANLDDINGDGYSELLVSAPGRNSQAGATYVYSLVPTCSDADGDGYGAAETLACPNVGIDCDDTNPSVNPGALELRQCDGIDANCDGLDSYDSDGDGFDACAGDCDDANPSVNPGAVEVPGNGIDDDCNAATPGGCTPQMTVGVELSAMQAAAAFAPYLVPGLGLGFAALRLRRRR